MMKSKIRTNKRSRKAKTSRKKKTKTGRKKKTKTVRSQAKLVIDMLRELKWPKTERANVLREGQTKYEGFVLGIVTSWAGKGSRSGYCKILSLKSREPKYKKLLREAKTLMRLKDPKFKFTSIQFNKNHRAAKHRDAKNTGVSYIVGLGDYEGGELIIYDENDQNPVKHDIKNKFNTFDGSLYPHETAPFKGERYTMVYYST